MLDRAGQSGTAVISILMTWDVDVVSRRRVAGAAASAWVEQSVEVDGHQLNQLVRTNSGRWDQVWQVRQDLVHVRFCLAQIWPRTTQHTLRNSLLTVENKGVVIKKQWFWWSCLFVGATDSPPVHLSSKDLLHVDVSSQQQSIRHKGCKRLPFPHHSLFFISEKSCWTTTTTR